MPDRPKKKLFLEKQLQHHLPEHKFDILEAVNTRHLKNHHVGCALSHRRVISQAQASGAKHVMVFEEDAVLHNQFNEQIFDVYEQVEKTQWDVLFLGACVWNPKPSTGKPPRVFEPVGELDKLLRIWGCTCTHGIVYSERCYDYILASLPNNEKEMIKWCDQHIAIDQWLMYHFQGVYKNGKPGSVRRGNRKFNCYMPKPRLVSQPFLIGDKKQDSPGDFPDMKDWV